MLYLYVLLVHLLSSTSAKSCDFIKCANILDEVCGITMFKDGLKPKISKFQNMCLLRLLSCQQEPIAAIHRTDDSACNITKPTTEKIDLKSGRRVNDFSIVGAHQACNHTCPTTCPDTYEPACAQIWKAGMETFRYRPMINHCHIDLFSCAAATNVTIQPLGKCYKNPAGLLFMQQVAALKSLDLLDDKWADRRLFKSSDDYFLKEVIKGHLWKFANSEEPILPEHGEVKVNHTTTLRTL